MQSAGSVTGNSESQDGEEKYRDDDDSNATTSQNPSIIASSGYYDAEKCRANIANRVSKIDRFVAQVLRVIDVEIEVYSRLSKVLNMFVKHSAKVAHDFTMKCRLGSQRHRQDRILNQSKNGAKKQLAAMPPTISNDLLYGEGVHLVQELLDQAITFVPPKHVKRRKTARDCELTGENSKGQEVFDPSIFVKKLEKSILVNVQKSEAIMKKLDALKRLFRNLASEHRDKVDHVYAAEEERQSSTVIRRSAYNLSIAAIKATSTPIHVSPSVNNITRG